MKMDDRAKKKKKETLRWNVLLPLDNGGKQDSGRNEKKAKKAPGAICKEMDNALQELHIHRQQYHGGSFIGDHIRKMLQVKL